MESSTLISVVTPIHTTNHRLPEIRKALSSATHPYELIMVLNNPELSEHIVAKASNELVIVSQRKGRGFAFLHGIASAKGNITILLHSDTILPRGWDQDILGALEDPRVVGGGFSISYDTSKPYLDVVSRASNKWAQVTGQLYGDRAIFVRSDVLRRCLPKLEVPLFEDLRLTKCMRSYGRVVTLKEKVETSAEKFRIHGVVQYIVRIWLSQIWYILGGSPFRIYNFYYSKS